MIHIPYPHICKTFKKNPKPNPKQKENKLATLIRHKLISHVHDLKQNSFSSKRLGLEKLVGSVLGSLSCLLQGCWFDPLLRNNFFGRRDFFSFESTWVLTPFPQNSFGWKYKPRSSLCTHAFHRTDSKLPHIHILDWWMPATKAHPACTIYEDGMWLPEWLD